MGAGRSLAPALSIKLLNVRTGNMSPATRALVDSGADSSMFPLDWAARLGIDVQNDCVESENNTAGGKTKTYYYPPGIDAVVMGQKTHLYATFGATLDILILGREDFFARFKVSFDQQAKTFTLEPYPSAA
jgi:Aspartyl protease